MIPIGDLRGLPLTGHSLVVVVATIAGLATDRDHMGDSLENACRLRGRDSKGQYPQQDRKEKIK